MAGVSNEATPVKKVVGLAEVQAVATPYFVCVECGRPVARLFREYNRGNIRLGRCVSPPAVNFPHVQAPTGAVCCIVPVCVISHLSAL